MTEPFDLAGALRAALAKLTSRERGVLAEVLVHGGDAASIAATNLVSVDRASQWIAEARARLDERLALELRAAGLRDPDIAARLADRASIDAALRASLAERDTGVQSPRWLRDCLGARIHWSGPVGDPARVSEAALYRVEGPPDALGRSSLLAVGRSGAFGAEWERWIRQRPRVAVYTGAVSDDSSPARDLAEHVEALTLYWHRPAFSSWIDTYRGPALIVENLGQRGTLLPMYSSGSVTGAGR